MNEEDYPNSEAHVKALKESNTELLEERDYWKGLVDWVKSDDSRIRKERNDAQLEARDAKRRTIALERERQILLHLLTIKHNPDVDALVKAALAHSRSGKELFWEEVMAQVSKISLDKMAQEAQEMGLYD